MRDRNVARDPVQDLKGTLAQLVTRQSGDRRKSGATGVQNAGHDASNGRPSGECVVASAKDKAGSRFGRRRLWRLARASSSSRRPPGARLVAAAIDLGRIFFARITVANSAREGAYEASYGGTYVANTACGASNSVMCAVLNEAQSSLTIAPADVTSTCVGPAGAPPALVRRRRDHPRHRPLHALDADPLGVLRRHEHHVQLDGLRRHRPDPVHGRSTPTSAPTPTPVPTPTVLPTVTPFPTPSPVSDHVADADPQPTCSPPVANFSWTQQNKNKPVVFTDGEHPLDADVRATARSPFWRWEYGPPTTPPSAGGTPTRSATIRHENCNVPGHADGHQCRSVP